MNKCPKCGADCLIAGDSWTKWECQSYSEYGHMTESVGCLRRQLAAVAKERDEAGLWRVQEGAD